MSITIPKINKIAISTSLVRQLIAEQFPQWANLAIKEVVVNGMDNRTFHLGDTMSVRMPTAQPYALKIEKGQHWLPIIAKQLTFTIPTPIAMGETTDYYPYCWSIYKWIDQVL